MSFPENNSMWHELLRHWTFLKIFLLSLEGKIKILRIFADDVIGTIFDQKYFQCILSEYLTNFESFSPENGIVGVSLKPPQPKFFPGCGTF